MLPWLLNSIYTVYVGVYYTKGVWCSMWRKEEVCALQVPALSSSSLLFIAATHCGPAQMSCHLFPVHTLSLYFEIICWRQMVLTQAWRVNIPELLSQTSSCILAPVLQVNFSCCRSNKPLVLDVSAGFPCCPTWSQAPQLRWTAFKKTWVLSLLWSLAPSCWKHCHRILTIIIFSNKTFEYAFWYLVQVLPWMWHWAHAGDMI